MAKEQKSYQVLEFLPLVKIIFMTLAQECNFLDRKKPELFGLK